MTEGSFLLKSFAKINLGLEVVGRRSDGYHLLRTVFQTIGLHDLIQVKTGRGRGFRLAGDGRVDWAGANTIRHAVELFSRLTGKSADIEIKVKKRIPPGGGLAGGSSNAGVMLLFLNEFTGLRLSLPQLMTMAAEIGADVPFFLVGGRVLGLGAGDLLFALPDPGPAWAALCFSPLAVGTGRVFKALTLTRKPGDSKIGTFIRKNDFSQLENDLEKTAISLFPELGAMKKKMQDSGLADVMMTGSGSTFFSLLTPQQKAKDRYSSLELHLFPLLGRREYLADIGVWPSGKASVFGADIRRFESSHPRWPHE